MPTRHFAISGQPGVGKTTLVRKVYDHLRDKYPTYKLNGFYTIEERDVSGQRTGFMVKSVNEDLTAQLATTLYPPFFKGPFVGKYAVMVEEFEHIAVQTLRSDNIDPCDVMMLDELGRMESFSREFCECFVDWLYKHNNILVATIPISRAKLPFVKVLTDSPDTQIVNVTKRNRDQLVGQLVDTISDLL